MNKVKLLSLLAVILLTVVNCSYVKKRTLNLFTSNAVVTERSKRCIECHTTKTPAIVNSWQASRHAEQGIGCFECHEAEGGDIDGFDHYEQTVATLVTPKDCGECHAAESEQFLASHHAKGGEVLNSLDNYLGEVVEGYAASISGCQQCHGSVVEVLDDGRLSAGSWPNFGIGRINPDGSSGSCSACHSRHDFSISQARSPETCGKCHMGPDHPQKEVYEESKHYIAYSSSKDLMNMDSREWVVGVDYSAAPTCATCHVSATPNQSRSHDIGLRVSWNLRAVVSFKTENSERKRMAMKDVCSSCHNPNYIDNFYHQLDTGVELYNNKFAIPARDIIDKLRKMNKLDDTPFNEKIEWTFFYLWHHEGRRARNGIAMMGPDYVQWHGFYDIAERFYIEFVHEAEELAPGIMDEVLSRPEHSWFRNKMSKEERDKMNKFYKDKYRGN